jgi:putative membrane protein
MAEPPAPDLRILQANERTLLAWVRTGLALMAFGFVLARIGVWLQAEGAHDAEASASNAGGLAFLVVGTLCHPVAAARFVRARRAIVEGRAIVPGAAAAVALALAVAALGVVMVAYLASR